MILLYPGKEKNRLDDYRAVLQDYQVYPFGDALEDLTMEELIKAATENPQDDQGDKDPFLFFVNEDVKPLGALISKMEEAGLNARRTAIATDNNKSWKFKDLYQEISREAAYFEKRDKLADAIKNADPKRIMEDPQYGKIIMTFFEMLKAPELEEEVLDMALQVAENL